MDIYGVTAYDNEYLDYLQMLIVGTDNAQKKFEELSHDERFTDVKIRQMNIGDDGVVCYFRVA